MARPNWEYVRVDVLLPSHHKLDGLHPAAKWTLIELWCHCGQHLTDGFVRDAIWRKIGTPNSRRQIVAAGLAEPVTGGYQMHDYLEHQRSRADVEALKKKRAEAGRKGGMAKASAKQELQQEPEHLSSKSVAEAEAEAEAEVVSGPVSIKPPVGNARANPDLMLIRAVQQAITDRTRRTITDDQALAIARQVIGSETVRNPVPYVTTAINRDPNPQRFLPTPVPPPLRLSPPRPDQSQINERGRAAAKAALHARSNGHEGPAIPAEGTTP